MLEEERLPTPSLRLGEGRCEQPFEARSVVNISGMSHGAISAPALRSLSRGAASAGCWLDTGEGGLAAERLLELAKVERRAAREQTVRQSARPGRRRDRRRARRYVIAQHSP